jgi:5,10-methylenetetrahydromethanopterin reductase
MRVSIELLPDPPAAEVLSAICAADEVGLHTAFLVDEIYHRDAWLILAAAAQRTTRIRLAPGVAHMTLRDPLLAAQQLATLDELTGGRAGAAFSVGNLAMLEQFGFDPAELHVAPRLARLTPPCGRCSTRARRRWTGGSTATTGCSQLRALRPTGCRSCWARWAGR